MYMKHRTLVKRNFSNLSSGYHPVHGICIQIWKKAQLSSAKNFNFRICVTFEILCSIVSCRAQRGGWKLFIACHDNPICSYRIPFHLTFTCPASFCNTVRSVFIRSIRIAFERQAVYERGETIAFQSTNSHHRTFNANEIRILSLRLSLELAMQYS